MVLKGPSLDLELSAKFWTFGGLSPTSTNKKNVRCEFRKKDQSGKGAKTKSKMSTFWQKETNSEKT